MITDYVVPSLASAELSLKKYQIIYESVYSYLCIPRLTVTLFLTKWIDNLSRYLSLQIPVKTLCTVHRCGKTKDVFVLCSGCAWYVFTVFCFFVLYVICVWSNSHHSHPVHLFNTWIFIMNVKCRMHGSHRKPYICFSFDFLIQYSANGTCLTSVNMHKYVTSLWRLWKSYIFPDLYWNSLTWLTGND